MKLTTQYDTATEEHEPEVEVEAPFQLMTNDRIVLTTNEEVEVEPPKFNVFASDNGDIWDHEAELSSRDPNRPYVISIDEFHEDDMGYRQSVLTYYEGDNVVVDEHDSVMFQHEKVLGALLFGHGSSDENVVYIRNEKLAVEYEVLRHQSSYAVEVEGHQIEEELGSGDLRHSAFRLRDD